MSSTMIAGYQDLLETLFHDLITITTTPLSTELGHGHPSNGRPSRVLTGGILLTGSAGVGKTFLVSSLAHRLTTTRITTVSPTAARTGRKSPCSRDETVLDGQYQQHVHEEDEDPRYQEWAIQWIDLHSLWLRVAESSFASTDLIASWILPNPQRQQRQQQEKETLLQTLLVLDDLHLLSPSSSNDAQSSEATTNTSTVMASTQPDYYSPETQRMEAALVHVLDQVALDPSMRVQIIGMAQSSHEVPISLTKVHRLDCHYHMEPPSQWQRQEILQTLLESLLEQEREQQQKQPTAKTTSDEGMTTGSSSPQHRQLATTATSQNKDNRENNINNNNIINNNNETVNDGKLAKLAHQWATRLSTTVTAGFVAGDLAHLCLNAHLRAQATVLMSSDSQRGGGEDEEREWETARLEAWLERQHICETDTDTTTRLVPVSWDDLVSVAQSMVPSQLRWLDVIRPPLLLLTEDETTVEETADAIAAQSFSRWYAHHQRCWNSFVGYETLKKHMFRSIVLPWRQALLLAQSKGNNNNDKYSNDVGDTTTKTITTRQPKNDTEYNDKSGGSSTSSSLLLSSSSSRPPQPPQPPRGVVLYGPSGCGKTLAATCLGASCGLPMIRIRPADLLDQWLGGSEARLRLVFQRARNAAPCLLFFDELDALATNRSSDDGYGGDTTGVMSRLLSTFLNELDGVSTASTAATTTASNTSTASSLSSNLGVLVVACTNRMESLDAALLRPGRLEEHIQVSPPTVPDVQAILRHYFSWPSSENRETDHKQEDKFGNVLAKEEEEERTDSSFGLFVTPMVDLDHLATELVKHNPRHAVTAATLEGLAREAVLRCIRRQTDSSTSLKQQQQQQNPQAHPSRIDEDDRAPVWPPDLVSSQDIQEALKALHLIVS